MNTSHTLTVLSELLLAKNLPFGLQTTLHTLEECPSSGPSFISSPGIPPGNQQQVLLLLHHPTRMPGILPTHGPRAFGWAFALSLDGIELGVI